MKPPPPDNKPTMCQNKKKTIVFLYGPVRFKGTVYKTQMMEREMWKTPWDACSCIQSHKRKAVEDIQSNLKAPLTSLFDLEE